MTIRGWRARIEPAREAAKGEKTMTQRSWSGGRLILFGALAAALLVCTYPLLRAADAPVAGTAAPDFKLTSQEGAAVSLKDFRGQWVVLYFYPKDFTSGCTLEAHNFQRDLAEYEKRHAVIL